MPPKCCLRLYVDWRYRCRGWRTHASNGSSVTSCPHPRYIRKHPSGSDYLFQCLIAPCWIKATTPKQTLSSMCRVVLCETVGLINRADYPPMTSFHKEKAVVPAPFQVKPQGSKLQVVPYLRCQFFAWKRHPLLHRLELVNYTTKRDAISDQCTVHFHAICTRE